MADKTSNIRKPDSTKGATESDRGDSRTPSNGRSPKFQPTLLESSPRGSDLESRLRELENRHRSPSPIERREQVTTSRDSSPLTPLASPDRPATPEHETASEYETTSESQKSDPNDSDYQPPKKVITSSPEVSDSSEWLVITPSPKFSDSDYKLPTESGHSDSDASSSDEESPTRSARKRRRAVTPSSEGSDNDVPNQAIQPRRKIRKIAEYTDDESTGQNSHRGSPHSDVISSDEASPKKIVRKRNRNLLPEASEIEDLEEAIRHRRKIRKIAKYTDDEE